MKDIYLIKYSVKGIKTLEQLVSLSFYKKTILNDMDTQKYNIKGIYGMNGSGKSGIVTSVDILRNVLTNSGYLNNPIAQKNLEAIIHKKTEELFIEADFVAKFENIIIYFQYEITISKNKSGKYSISHEKLSSRKAASKNDSMEMIFEAIDGELAFIQQKNHEEFSDEIIEKTKNLLSASSLCSLFFEKIFAPAVKTYEKYKNNLFGSLTALWIFGQKLHVYLDQSDDHRAYFVKNSLRHLPNLEDNHSNIDSLISHLVEMDGESLSVISVNENIVPKDMYEYFEKAVDNLYEFLHIFKLDLQKIEIDRKEDHNVFVCSLIMVYDAYRIYAEFESTGIKKLIKLFAYLREMVQGGIVFIDEFDSNLHDVYLCALLEYLMEYGEGQLCFTTHNVGPMDVLKQHKKSIDFLSIDHKIYPWTTNGNYSPSKLYRNGMIEGSPFNVDSIDFIGVFDLGEEDE